jgi:hypothetical protein
MKVYQQKPGVNLDDRICAVDTHDCDLFDLFILSDRWELVRYDKISLILTHAIFQRIK